MEHASFATFRTSGRAVIAGPRASDPGMTPIYVGLALSWLVLIVAMPLVDISVDVILLAAFLLICGLAIWAAACLRMRGLARIATAIEAWGLFSAASLAGILGTYVVTRSSVPFADPWMASADRLIAPVLDWRQSLFFIASHPLLVHLAAWAYGSLEWQSAALILLCCATNHSSRCAQFVLRWMIALALVVAIFALLPCNGPDAFYGISHAEVPSIHSNAGWCAPPIMAWLRAAGPVRLDPSALDGIVTFPSFHAAAATLLAWGFWTIRRVRWPMLALNVAMLAATPSIGGHYYVDVLAGALLAGISIMLPAWSSRLWRLWPLRNASGLDADPRLA